jgi:hypothetical protein
MFYNYHALAAPAYLALIIVAALPSCIMTACTSSTPSDCTSCAACTATDSGTGGATGVWVTNSQSCASSAGQCVSTTVDLFNLCQDNSSNPTYVATSPGPQMCSNCSRTCAPNPVLSNTKCAWNHEGLSVSPAECGAGLVIGKVLFASYGKNSFGSSPESCSAAAYKIANPYCHSPKSVSAVTSACVGKKQCSVMAENKVFDDPCSFQSKQLGIVVQCTEPRIAAFVLIKARVESITGLTSGSVTQSSDILDVTIAKSPQGSMFYRMITTSSGSQSVIAHLPLSKAFTTKMGFHIQYWNKGLWADLGLPLSDEYEVQINGETGARQDFELGTMYWTQSKNEWWLVCSSDQIYNCLNCASCTKYGYWSSRSTRNPSASDSSNTVGQCHLSYDHAPCGSYVFSSCTSNSVSHSYRTCPSSSFSEAEIYGGIAVAVLFWNINIILVASVARRKGLNPGLYVILSAAFFVLAWFFLCCGSNQSDGQVLNGREGVELKCLNVQAHPNPNGQSPAAAPFGNAVPDSSNPDTANSGAASAPPYDQPHAPAFQGSNAPTASPQPAAFEQCSEHVHTEASAENSQNLPVIKPY